jgi:ABC-type branched-subunit amino acid transport system ATPase component
VLLDEPTAGMSKSETTRFIDLIREVTVGKTLLTVEHDMGVVFGLADKIAVLVYGEVIAFDVPDAVRANARCRKPISARCWRTLRPPKPAPGPRGRSLTMLLDVSNLHAYYGKSHILHGVDMKVGEGEIVSLLGRNGSGRSTTVKTIMGLVAGEGSIKPARPADPRPPHLRHRAPRHRLRAREPRHLPEAHGAPEPAARRESAASRTRAGRSMTCTSCFPRLKEREHTEAGVLSGRRAADADVVPHADGRPGPDHD